MVSGRPAAFPEWPGSCRGLTRRQMLRPWRPVAGRVQVEGLATSPLSVKGHFCERASLFQCNLCCVLLLQGKVPWDDKDLRSLAVLGAGVAAGFLYFYFRDSGKEITWKHFVQYYLARGLVRGFACCWPWKEMACRPWGADMTTLLHPHTCPLPETLTHCVLALASHFTWFCL